MDRSAVEAWLSRFRWEHAAKQTLAIYREVLP